MINQSTPVEKPGMIAQYVPAIQWMKSYDRSWLRADIIAGLTIWAVVVPQAIAYAQIAGLPPQAGLYTAFAGCVAYALLGTSRQLVVSPMSGPAAVSAAVVAPLALGNTDRFYDLTMALALFTGIVFIVLGLMKAGFISQFVAPAVQAGFMFGLGMTIVVDQIPKLIGIPASDGAFLHQVRDVFRNLDQASGWTAAIGLTGLTAMFLLRKYVPLVPSALLVVAVAIAGTALFDLDQHGVAIVGDVPRAIPLPSLPTSLYLSDLGTLVAGALAIAVIGYAESNSVAEQFAEEHRYDIKPNQELLALGGANIMSGLFKGFITGGGASQSAANDRAGAKSQLAVLILGVLCALTSALLMPVFKDLPLAILAAIVINAVSGFINVPALERVRKLRMGAFAIAMIALLAVLVLGILPGLLLGIALSIVVMLGFQSRPKHSVLGNIPGTSAFLDVTTHPLAVQQPGILVFRLNMPLIFINSSWMRDSLKEQIAATNPRPTVVVIDMQMSPEIDIKGVDTLKRIHDELAEEEIELRLAQVHFPVQELLDRSGLTNLLGEDHLYRSLEQATRS